jgi:hypothetical protein
MRIQALSKRDERILELWRKDNDQPTAHDLVTSMRETHFNSTRQDFPAIDSITESNMPEYQTSIAFQPQKSIMGEGSLQFVDNKQSFFSTTQGTFDISGG